MAEAPLTPVEQPAVMQSGSGGVHPGPIALQFRRALPGANTTMAALPPAFPEAIGFPEPIGDQVSAMDALDIEQLDLTIIEDDDADSSDSSDSSDGDSPDSPAGPASSRLLWSGAKNR